jgi:hypothetical protein
MSPDLAGAILALGMATDETSARYWLAVCARRGAEQPLLEHLFDTWRRSVQPVTITREDPRP